MTSASKSALLLSPCLRWAWEGAKPYEDQYADTTKRDKGTNFHAGIERYFRSGELDAMSEIKPNWDDVAEWLCLAIGWVKAFLEPRCESIHPEVYVGFNFETGEYHVDPTVRNRAYPKDMPGFLPGTADLVCVLHDGSLLVADWKTGGGTGADKQLLTLALGLRHVFRKADGTLRPIKLAILYVSDDGVHPVEWVVSEGDLQSHQHAMAFQLADVGVRNEPVPGVHCTQLYCPHLAYCPGITQVVESASEGAQSLLAPGRLVRRYSLAEAPSSEEHAGYIMERVTAAKRQMAFYEERIRAWASNGGRVIAGDFEYSKKADGFRWRTKK